MNCQRHGLPFDPAIVQHLHDKYYIGRKLEMRACHPRDLTDQVVQPLPVSPPAGRAHDPNCSTRSARPTSWRTRRTWERPRDDVEPAIGPASRARTCSRVLIGGAVSRAGVAALGGLSRDEPRHRSAAARRRSARRRADLSAAARVCRRSAPVRPRGDRVSMTSAAEPAGAVAPIFPKPRPRPRWASGLLDRHRRQDLARLQLRPAAGESRRHGPRPLPHRAASDLSRLPPHPCSLSLPRIRPAWNARRSPDRR